MALIRWTDKLKMEVTECDEQHKQLVALINTFHEALRGGNASEVTGKVLADLLDFAAHHHATEEQLLKLHDYPELESHKRLHDALIVQVKELRGKVNRGESVAGETVDFLKEWVDHHIMVVDKRSGAFLRARGVK